MELPLVLNQARRWGLLRLGGIGASQAGVAVVTAMLVRALFDGLTGGEASRAEDSTWILGLGLCLSVLALAWLRLQENVQAERLGQSYVIDVRSTLFRQLCRLSPRAIQSSHGAIFIRFVGDLSAMRRWVSQGLARLAVAGITACGALGALACVAPILALSVSLIIGLGTVGVLRFGMPMQEAVRAARRRRSRLAGNVSGKISAFPVLQVFGQTNRERRRMERDSHRLSEAMIAQAAAAGRLRAITDATPVLATAGALVVGSLQVFSGHISIGTVVAAMSIVGILTSPLRDLGRTYEYWRTAQVAREKLQSFLRLPMTVQQVSNAVLLEEGPGLLAFRNVSINGAITDISIEAVPASRVAIVGPNGSGKSTLLALAARLFDPDTGHILIDGQDIQLVTLRSLRKTVSMVGPDLPLLRGSVGRNLCYRNPRVSEKELKRICQSCGIDQVLDELPAGLQTRLREGGLNLSVGQRQRVALARALIGNPRILLLDEADANLDTKTLTILERIIANFPGTVLLITHRPELLRKVDQIWHLDRGRLVEVGSPQELLSRPGKTQQLFRRSISLVSESSTNLRRC